MSNKITTILKPHTRDLGGFTVRRVLPSAAHQMIGSFIFFDHMGPVVMPPGQGLDVRPHPHIGLATVTYLFEGEIEHRDSLGSVQVIRPGDVNWMTAGRGIVHSERSPAAVRAAGATMQGIQTWVALPVSAEETAPQFFHHPKATLPVVQTDGSTVRMIAGHGFGLRSPVDVFSPTLYAAIEFAANASLTIPPEHIERAVYAVDAPLLVDGQRLDPGQMAVLSAGQAVQVIAPAAARAMLIGGAPMDGRRFIWWNFVASSKQRIDTAKADWAAERFDPVAGETERIPLPER